MWSSKELHLKVSSAAANSTALCSATTAQASRADQLRRAALQLFTTACCDEAAHRGDTKAACCVVVSVQKGRATGRSTAQMQLWQCCACHQPSVNKQQQHEISSTRSNTAADGSCITCCITTPSSLSLQATAAHMPACCTHSHKRMHAVTPCFPCCLVADC